MKPLYKFSFSEAKRNNEVEEFRESLRENIRCRDFLDHEIGERSDGIGNGRNISIFPMIKGIMNLPYAPIAAL